MGDGGQQVGDEEPESGGGGGHSPGGEGGAAVRSGGPQTILYSPDQGGGVGRISEPVSSLDGANNSQAPETCLPLSHPRHRQEHRGGHHRHAEQRHPQLQHPAGGEDGPDPHQHPHTHQPLGHGQDQLQPEHSQLLLPAEEPHRGGPAQSEHPGSPLTVTSAQHSHNTRQYFSYTANFLQRLYSYYFYLYLLWLPKKF